MFVKNFVFKLRGKKLWFVLAVGIIVAITITVYTFIEVSSKNKNSNYLEITSLLKNNNIFNTSSYYTEYEVTVLSNKNRNVYNMKEWYSKKNGDKKSDNFKFEYFNSENNSTTYILKDNTLQVKNINELNEYIVNDYIIKKENLLSISTFTRYV